MRRDKQNYITVKHLSSLASVMFSTAKLDKGYRPPKSTKSSQLSREQISTKIF